MPEEEVSYYEIALTSKQVLVTFIVALACVALAFFAGVWVGQQEEGTVASVADAGTADESGNGAPALGFFTQDESDADPSDSVTTDVRGADLDETESPESEAQPQVPAGQDPASVDKGTVAPPGAIVLQVLSSPNRGIAEDIQTRLQGAGYTAYMQSFDRGGEVFYRVRIGPFRDRAGAEAAKERVDHAFNVQTWITTAE